MKVWENVFDKGSNSGKWSLKQVEILSLWKEWCAMFVK